MIDLAHGWISYLVYHKGLFWDRFCLIYFYDMFIFCNDINFASYADDNTSYCIGKTPEEVISQLEKSSKSIFEWFENNVMKANPDKCHLLLSKNENLRQILMKIEFRI